MFDGGKRYDIAMSLFIFRLFCEEWNGMIDNKKCGLRGTSLLLVVFLPPVFAKILKCGIIGLGGENLDRYQPNYSLIAATFNLSFEKASKSELHMCDMSREATEN